MSTMTAAQVRPAPAPRRTPPATRPPLRVVPVPRRRRSRAPFVALVVTLLGGGLVALLLLNTALSEGAFVESSLQERNARLVEQKQQLQRKAAQLSSPQSLAERARELGMVPGGSPMFLDTQTGDVTGGEAANGEPGARPGAR